MLRLRWSNRLSVHRWPLAAWLAGLAVVLLIRFPGKFLLDPPFLMDFDLFRRVAQRVVAHESTHLYAPVGTEQALFKYAPCWALFLVPFGWASPQTGAVIWATLTVAWLLGTCWLADCIARHIGLSPPRWLSVLAVIILVRPITSEFLLGQTNLLWGFLITAFVWLELTQRRWPAALCLVLGISLKVPALLFLVYLVCRRTWQTVGRVLACLALLNIGSALWLLPSAPSQLFFSWAHALATSGPNRAFEIGSQSLLALLGRLLRPDGYGFNLLALQDQSVMLIAVAIQLALFVVVFLLPHRPLRFPSQLFVMDSALLATLMVLFSPTCWIPTYNALLFPLWIALAWLLQRDQHLWRSPSLIAGALVMGILALMTHSKFWRLLGIHYVRGESYVYLVFMVFPQLGLALAWVLWSVRRRLQAQARADVP